MIAVLAARGQVVVARAPCRGGRRARRARRARGAVRATTVLPKRSHLEVRRSARSAASTASAIACSSPLTDGMSTSRSVSVDRVLREVQVEGACRHPTSHRARLAALRYRGPRDCRRPSVPQRPPPPVAGDAFGATASRRSPAPDEGDACSTSGTPPPRSAPATDEAPTEHLDGARGRRRGPRSAPRRRADGRRGPAGAAGRHRRRLAAAAPAQPPAGARRTASTSTASSACSTNVVWTSAGPCAVEGFELTRARLPRRTGQA